eukprot:TRINITY_DN32417_c0_g1_i1.p1 TRINITY_DN32417_c0_g1~~TRINITY_DN32417_c0_g1_i1.p1  ORF type:complete len:318 (-),score=31.78 TRINITY_DN32417_c0_g1_i1:144-959(-)
MHAEACPDDSCTMANSFLQVDLPAQSDEIRDYGSGREPDLEATFLPSVDCVRVIALEGSSMRHPMEDQLKEFGLWNRTFWQTEKQDPDGSVAGCWRAHVKAWAASSNCSNLLVLEEDAFFDVSTESYSRFPGPGPTYAEMFLQSAAAYDLLLLGWVPGYRMPSVERLPGSSCVFRLSGDWKQTHAYIISKQARQRLSNLNLEFNGLDIDTYLSSLSNSMTHLAVKPSFAFQSVHNSSIVHHIRQGKLRSPATSKAAQDVVFDTQGFMNDCL